LPHAFNNNPRTKEQKDIFQKHGKAPSSSHKLSNGTLKLMFDRSDKASQPLKTPEPPATETLLTEGDQGSDSKIADWVKKRKAGQRKYGNRRGTLLTSPSGISDDALAIGYSMLGGE